MCSRLAVILLAFLAGTGVAGTWGPDVLIDTGALGAFAVSADTTGRLWAATGAGSRLRLFASTDAGATWQLRLEHDAGSALLDLELCAGWGEVNALYLPFLASSGDGDLWLLRLGWDDTAAVVLPIAVGPDTVDDFSFALDHDHSYYLYCVTANEHRAGLTGFFSRSTDFGATWEPGQSWWNAHDPQVLYVAGSTVHCIWRFAQDGTQVHHQISRRYAAPGSWEPHRIAARGDYLRWDPQLAEVDTLPERLARMWLTYTLGWRDSSRTDIRFAVGGNDGRQWGAEHNWSSPYHDEWFAGIASDPWTPNGMTGLVYNFGGRGAGDSTVVRWRWTSAFEPEWWSDAVTVSNRRANAAVPACRPRVLYAPGTPLTLPLVFFAGFDSAGARGLYCDAPWFAEPGPPQPQPIVATPNPARGRVEFALAAPEPGRYELAVHDALGRRLWFGAQTAARGSELRPGWNGQDSPAGNYIVVVRGAGRTWRTTLTLVR
jgi:hypothetical protein